MSDIYIYLTPRVQKNAHHTKYIDISTCEYSSKTGMKFRQFILGKGNCLSSDKESEFLDMMQQHPYIHIEKEIYEKFADDISEYFLELHWSYSYDTIEADGAAKAFSHLYFTLWRSGVLELLYKAALPNLAFAVQTELAENINRTGTRPQDIFGLPLHMLRILDSYGQDAEKTLEYAIFTENMNRQNRVKTKAVFTKYRDFIEKNIPTGMQWKYLEKIFELNVGSERELQQSRIIYWALGMSRCEKSIDRYVLFQKQQRILAEYFPYHGVPAEWGLERALEMQKLILDELPNEAYINTDLKKTAATCDLNGFQNENYITVVPTSLKQITCEARGQNNCLIECGYVRKVVDGECILVFIRKKKKINKSFITVEISPDRKIVQALAADNQELNETQQQFLEAFARDRHISLQNQTAGFPV